MAEHIFTGAPGEIEATIPAADLVDATGVVFLIVPLFGVPFESTAVASGGTDPVTYVAPLSAAQTTVERAGLCKAYARIDGADADVFPKYTLAVEFRVYEPGEVA